MQATCVKNYSFCSNSGKIPIPQLYRFIFSYECEAL